MTENEIRQRVVAAAKKYLGCKESDGSHKKFIDRYNAFQPLPRNHKMTYTAAWCATFVSAIAIETGLTDIMPVECGCGYMISAYKKLGRWREDENYTPKAGDVIFYDWDDGKDFVSTDNLGAPEHVGIGTGVSGDVISVSEGNKADAVGTREVKINGRYIRGFGLPDYSSKATPEVKPAPAEAPEPAEKPKKVSKRVPVVMKKLWNTLTCDRMAIMVISSTTKLSTARSVTTVPKDLANVTLS